MALPTQKQTKSHRLQRAKHFALKPVATSVCSKCQKAVLPHHICQFCGTYRGKELLKIKIAGSKKTVKPAAKPAKEVKAEKTAKESK